jgi:hypothetical protein
MGKKICENGKFVISFIQQHHDPLTIFCHYETNSMLLKPTKMQLSTDFLIVERLFKLKLAIEQTIADPNWTIFVNTMRTI